MAEQQPNTLRPVKRFITKHDANGTAVFDDEIAAEAAAFKIPTGDELFLAYATDQFPIDPSKDLGTYQHYQANPPGFTIPGGSVLCQIDFAPGSAAPLHRTWSLDYCVVIEGTVELVLDSEQVRTLQRGDIAIQRGTMHSWRNASTTEWARVLYVLQDSKPAEVAGKKLEQDFGGMGGP